MSMSGELIKERDRDPSFHASQAQFGLENALEMKRNRSLISADRYSSTIASCKDFPLAIHTGKALFLEPEQELNTVLLQEQQQKEKVHFLRRLSLINIKKQMAAFFSKVKDTMSGWKDGVWSFFGSNTVNKKEGATTEANFHKGKSNTIQKVVEVEVPPVSSPSTVDIEKRRIDEIEDTLAAYDAEMQKIGVNIKAMMEIACKIALYVGLLGNRYAKKEMKDYRDHMDVNIKKRVKTFENGHFWTYASVSILGVSSLFSFASIGGGFIAASTAGKILTGLGNAATPFSQLGQGTSKLSEIDSEKKQALRTEFDYVGENLKQSRSDQERAHEKTNQLMQEMLSNMRNAEQARAQSTKQAMT